MNSITIGSFTFTDSDILSGEVVKEHSVIGETLSADTMTFTVHTEHTGNAKLLTKSLEWYTTVNNTGFVIADTDFNSIAYATPVYFYVDGNLQGKFFATQITREGGSTFTVECTSAVGLLITAKHYGGIYQGVTASTLLADILNGISYTLDASLANATITGYLPIATKRDNLQQVLFAIGGAVKTLSNGSLEITPMSNIVTSEIGADRIYSGGSVIKKDAYDGVQLTEHNYFTSGESETLYDDSIIGEQVITFNEPHYYIQAVDGSGTSVLVYPTSLTAGVNYCIVQSTGSSSACTVTGKKYTHVQRVISEGTVTTTGDENIMQVTNAYLANPSIADTLAERLWAYAQCRNYIQQDITVSGEVAGDMVKILNPYSYESVNAIMTSFDMSLSGVNKANTEYIVGYTPEGVISGFSHYAMLTGAGSWSKTSDNLTLTQTSGNWVIDGTTVTGSQSLGDVDKIRIILVGGGSGGANGTAGGAGGDSNADFERYSTWSSMGSGYRVSLNAVNPGTGGSGGSGGSAGNGGSIFELSLNIDNSDSGNIAVGTGGTGGATPTDGTATTFTKGATSYSSASGKKYPYGYTEAKSSLTLGNKGTDGTAGGSGGDGASSGNGSDGDSVGTYTGGSGSEPYTEDRSSESRGMYCYYNHYGAGGGGASATANGSDANLHNGGAGASGGSGANATNYGAGGGGGNGGGGGGGASINYYDMWYRAGDWDANIYNGTGGAGGSAGTGGNGKQGCIIIYY